MDELQEQIAKELRSIVAIVEELTGLPSRWNGTVELVPDADFKGKKRFSCDIQIKTALATQDVRWATLIHETFHCVSAGYNRDDYQSFRGWEKGVSEQLQRLLRQDILSRLGISVEERVFQTEMPAHRYNHYITALQKIHHALTEDREKQNELQFFLDLFAIPLRGRPGHILSQAYQQPGLLRFELVKTFSSANSVLIGRLL